MGPFKEHSPFYLSRKTVQWPLPNSTSTCSSTNQLLLLRSSVPSQWLHSERAHQPAGSHQRQHSTHWQSRKPSQSAINFAQCSPMVCGFYRVFKVNPRNQGSQQNVGLFKKTKNIECWALWMFPNYQHTHALLCSLCIIVDAAYLGNSCYTTPVATKDGSACWGFPVPVADICGMQMNKCSLKQPSAPISFRLIQRSTCATFVRRKLFFPGAEKVKGDLSLPTQQLQRKGFLVPQARRQTRF